MNGAAVLHTAGILLAAGGNRAAAPSELRAVFTVSEIAALDSASLRAGQLAGDDRLASARREIIEARSPASLLIGRQKNIDKMADGCRIIGVAVSSRK